MTEEMDMFLSILPGQKLSVPEYREWIAEIESAISRQENAIDRHDDQGPVKLRHTFTPGLYTREIFMPKGALVVSRIHLFEHPFVVSQGKVSVFDGEQVVTIHGHYQGITKPGTKRLLYCHEDTIWTTFHVTDKKTFDEIDVDGVLTCSDFTAFESIANKEITL